MTVETIDPLQVPATASGWDRFADASNTVLYIALLGLGFLTPPVFGLYAYLFR